MKRLLGGLALSLALVGPAVAGPPYVTDDPQPTDLGHWEIYTFASGVHTPGDTSGEAGIDLNYGAAPNLQLTAVLPAGYDISDSSHAGAGVVELAAKYKFVRQETSGVDLAVFPRVFVPSPEARFGPRHVNLFLPVWAEKDFGPWSVFGGGGYTFNPGGQNRNFWTSGLAVTRAVGERLSLGGEVFHQSPDSVEARAFTGVNLGATWRLAPHWVLMAAGGPGVQNAREQGQYDFYLALQALY